MKVCSSSPMKNLSQDRSRYEWKISYKILIKLIEDGIKNSNKETINVFLLIRIRILNLLVQINIMLLQIHHYLDDFK